MRTFGRTVALVCTLTVTLCQASWVVAQSSRITVQVDKPGAAIPSTLFGLFFEDINFGADGGLYPERIKNRSFEFPDPLMAWKKIEDTSLGTVDILNEKPINANNAHYV